ncbi:hypothetical protein A9Q93_04020 [Nonlabens dokdonensis]|uniref:Uncharacterized protein n=2 Tax=Nonlabens dokdonensis TaxID=328515 RepID=A0A1Z8B686_9FLAO|nr:hypothetical protein A9Q93_04020 [Nonlabens dokdonensis]
MGVLVTRLQILPVLFCFILTVSYAQKEEQKKLPVQLTGSIGFNYDYYSFYQENYSSFRPRFPENLLRLNAQMSINFGKHFSIPISVNVTNQEVLYNLPSVPDESPLDYIQNPANNLSINPKYKWAQGFFGTQTPQYTPLTTGDIPMFGLGMEINPGSFILSAAFGTSQRAIEPDISLNIPGAYEQSITMARIGVGKLEGSKFTVNVVRVRDHINSVTIDPIGIEPIEGITVSPYAEFKLFKKLQIRTETAGSIFTSDLFNNGTIDEDYVTAVEDVITINASSTADFAHNSRIDWKGDKFQIGGEVQYIGPGFLPVGYRFVERDILDYKVNTGMKLFKDKLNLTGSFGIRTNNLNNTKLSSSERVISNVNVFAQVTESFSLNVNYSNFGFNNDANILNQRIELINNSITVSPSYTIKGEKYLHLISGNVALNSFEQFDVVSNAFAKAENSTYSLNYNISFLQIPLNIGLQSIYLENQLPTGDFNMLNYGLTASYKLLDKKLTPSIGFNYAHVDVPGFTTDNRSNFNLKLGYKLTKKLQCKLRYRYTNFSYGNSRPGGFLGQNRVQFSIQQRF